MSTTLKVSESNVIVGLGAYTHVTAHSGLYTVQVRATFQPSSSLVLTIAQSGSTSVSTSTSAPATSQTHSELRLVLNCAQGDTITVTMSSAAAIDNQLNTVKTVVAIQTTGIT